MTPENRRKNLADEWVVANQAWVAAESLMSLGLYRDAINRYYYAAFHAALGALLTRDLEPKTHHGVKVEFNRVFLHSGLLDTALGAALRHLEDEREEADYERTAVFTEEDACRARLDCQSLRDAVLDLMVREGWMER